MKHDHSFDCTRLSLAEEARIERDCSGSLLQGCAAVILDTTYVPQPVLVGRIGTFHIARASYDRAGLILGAL